MDKEMQAFIEAQMKAQLEDITGVIRDMGEALESRINKAEKRLRDEIGAVALEVLEVKQLARRIDDRTQHQVEALYEEVRITQKAVVKVEEHIGLPRSFPVAA
jgi:hypothetical protein